MTREEKEHIGKYILEMARLLEDGCYQQEMLLKAVHIIDEALEQEPTTKNDLGVDCISRDEVCRYVAEFVNHEFSTREEEELIDNIITGIECMPLVTPQEPRCKECKWWKDSDGKYRRGCGAESQCPINTHVVYCGEGYCYMFSPKIDIRGKNV